MRFYRSFEVDYKPTFSGHETFPLRYGWLKKAYDAIEGYEKPEESKRVFLDDNAISRFGVGKNMVSSMRHWAGATNIIEDKPNDKTLKLTEFGDLIFSESGLDPYMENPSTLWLLHWSLASNHFNTTWFWVFNLLQRVEFNRQHLLDSLTDLVKKYQWPRVSKATIKRDVECFIRTYVAHKTVRKKTYEDILESPFSELSLISSTGKRDGFKLNRGAKPTLGNGVFLYSLLEFWHNYTDANTLTFETLTYEPGSPGRVYLLDENELSHRLNSIEEETGGLLSWSETVGLKQLIRTRPPKKDEILEFIKRDYS